MERPSTTRTAAAMAAAQTGTTQRPSASSHLRLAATAATAAKKAASAARRPAKAVAPAAPGPLRRSLGSLARLHTFTLAWCLLLLLSSSVGSSIDATTPGEAAASAADDGAAAEDPLEVVVQRGTLRGSGSSEILVSAGAGAGAGAEAADGDDIQHLDDMGLDLEAAGPSSSPLLLNGTVQDRRLMTKSVFCICKKSAGNLRCGAMFYSLLQCNPNCVTTCHGKGMGMSGCVGMREVGWYTRLHYKYIDCKDSPLQA